MTRCFYHSNTIPVSKESYAYVRKVLHELLYKTDKILRELGCRYTISHGSLIEYQRGAPIYHDDDIDIRVDSRDFHRVRAYIGGAVKIDEANNVTFTKYWGDPNWYHVDLITREHDPYFNKNFPISLDLVTSNSCSNGFWERYDIDFDNLRCVKFMDIDTFAPSETDTHKVLLNGYGANYLRPNYEPYELMSAADIIMRRVPPVRPSKSGISAAQRRIPVKFPKKNL